MDNVIINKAEKTARENKPAEQEKPKKIVFQFGDLYKTSKDDFKKTFVSKAACKAYAEKCSCSNQGKSCTLTCKEYEEAEAYNPSKDYEEVNKEAKKQMQEKLEKEKEPEPKEKDSKA